MEKREQLSGVVGWPTQKLLFMLPQWLGKGFQGSVLRLRSDQGLYPNCASFGKFLNLSELMLPPLWSQD